MYLGDHIWFFGGSNREYARSHWHFGHTRIGDEANPDVMLLPSFKPPF